MEHIRCVHEKKLKFVCNFLVKRFPKKSDMKTHIKAVHEKTCDFVTKIVLFFLWGHERVHNGGKPYKCLKCGKGLKHKLSLDGHTKKSFRNHRIVCMYVASSLICLRIFSLFVIKIPEENKFSKPCEVSFGVEIVASKLHTDEV
jgi:hypothetical protein